MAQQAAGGGGQGQGGGSEGNDMMWIAAFFAGLLVVLWLTRASYFPYIFKFKYYELYFAAYFVNIDFNLMHEIINAQFDPKYLTWQQFFDLLNRAGSYYSFPVAITLFILTIILYIKNPNNKFNRTYNMLNFRQAQKSNWPQIIAPSKQDLTKVDPKEGPWASSFNPLYFARENKLLEIIVNPDPNPLLGELAKVPKLKEDKARQLFAAQLGYLWQGPDKLPIHTKALFAIFAAIVNKDRDTAFKMLRQFNTSLEYKDTPDYTGIEELLKKHKDAKLIKKLESRHAYVSTVMAALLELARTDGVLATADFLWLKTIDRQLWYILNNVGRRAAYPEVAGAIAHWRIESRMQRKLITPMIEEAVKALKLAIAEIIYPQDDD